MTNSDDTKKKIADVMKDHFDNVTLPQVKSTMFDEPNPLLQKNVDTGQAPKPREWTIYDCTIKANNFVLGYRPEGRCHNCKEVYHVIEKYAYDRLVKEVEELNKICELDIHIPQNLLKDKEALEKDWERLNIKCGEYSLENERLEKENALMREDMNSVAYRDYSAACDEIRWLEKELTRTQTMYKTTVVDTTNEIAVLKKEIERLKGNL